jgi:uncharacterized protein (TIGR00266 family)
MEVIERGKTAFTHLECILNPQEKIITESGAMASMDSGLEMKTGLKGGFLTALLRKFLGGESIFFNTFINLGSKPKKLIITKETPGDIVCRELNNETLFLQPGAFLCCTPGIKISLRWAGFRFLIGGEGLFRLAASGSGKVWIGVFGSLIEKEVAGEIIVDSGHLVAYSPNIKYKLQLSAGIFSSFFGKEGIVGRLEGHGKIILQTRSLNGLVSWLNPRLPVR